MFRKTIAVLLLFSIVLSSCGKKDKDKSNDFVRVIPTSAAPSTPPAPTTTTPSTPPAPPPPAPPPPAPPTTPTPPNFQHSEDKTPTESPAHSLPLPEAIEACIDVQLSSHFPPQACRSADEEDAKRRYVPFFRLRADNSERNDGFRRLTVKIIKPKPERFNIDLWQACLDSPPRLEKRESFHKATLACINSYTEYVKARLSCIKAELACPDPDEVDCPESELICDKVYEEYPESKLSCPNIKSNCFESDLIYEKVYNAASEAEKVCADHHNKSPKDCSKAMEIAGDLNLQFLASKKSCLESTDGSTHRFSENLS